MPKLTPARLDGLHGMRKFTAGELHALADSLEHDAVDPKSPDDPRWVSRWALRVRRLAEQKARSAEQHDSDRRARMTTQRAAAGDGASRRG